MARFCVGFVLAAVVLVVSVPALAGEGSGAAAKLRNCGDAVKVGAGAYDVRATRNVKCGKAKRVASRFFPGGEKRFNNWRCKKTKSLGAELAKGKCFRYGRNRPRQLVKFTFGA